MESFYQFKRLKIPLLFFIIIFFLFPLFINSARDFNNSRQPDSEKRIRSGSTPSGPVAERKKANDEFISIREAFLTENRNPGSYFYTWNYGFNNKHATEGLKANCPDNYKEIIQFLKGAYLSTYEYEVPSNQNKLKSEKREYYAEVVKVFETEMKECGNTLFRNYYEDIYLKATQHGHFLLAGKAFLNPNLKQEHTKRYDKEMKDIKDKYPLFKGILNQKPSFYDSCVKHVMFSTPGKEKPKIVDDPDGWKDAFTKLWENKCHTKRAQMKKFVEDTIARLDKVQKDCKNHPRVQRSACITELEQKVAFLPVDEKNLVFFQTCKENLADTWNCCSDSPQDCSWYDQIKNKYKKAVSQNQEQCSARVHNSLIGDIKTLCQNRAEACHKNCETELQDFKTKFLQCFFLPDWMPDAYYWEKSGSCYKHINAIRAHYNKLSKRKTAILSQESKATDIVDCGEPKKALETRIAQNNMKPNQISEDLCKEQTAENSSSQDGGSSAPQIGNGSSSGNSNSSSRSGNSSSSQSGNSSSQTAQAPNMPNSPGQMDFNSDPGSGPNSNNKNETESLIAADIKKKTSEKNPFSEDPGKFGESDDYERQFDPSFARGEGPGGSSYASSDKVDFPGSSSELSSSSSYKKSRQSRSIASLSGSILDSKTGFGPSGSFGFGSQRSYLASLGRATRKAFSSAFKPFKIPTVKSSFNVHGSEVNLLEQQKKLFDIFCKSHSCNFK